MSDSGRPRKRKRMPLFSSPPRGEVGRKPIEGAPPMPALTYPERGWACRAPRGVTLVEVIIVIAIILLSCLVLLMMVPRGREQARLATCTNNLRQIGTALAIYDQLHQQLPAIATVSGIDRPGGARSPGPLRTLLETLQLPDLTELKDPNSLPPPRTGEVPDERAVPGFICASDPNATAGWFAAPISYRATTGDSPSGDDGAFAIGRVLRLSAVEATDGSSFTAAFSERLVGDHLPNHPAPCNYQVIPEPLASSGCSATGDASAWRGDAGSSWSWADYRHTLYNHSLSLRSRLSCLAADGETAFMGASSGHVRGINLLLLDGSVTVVTREIDPRVWKEYARIGP
jgi:prepilin-type N-terminal cleavage/methylation domain-containing protein